jgi:hypothetical protein
VLDVLFWELKASFVTWTSYRRHRDRWIVVFYPKFFFFFSSCKVFSFWSSKHLNPEQWVFCLKSWIRIRIKWIGTDPQPCSWSL